MYLLHILTARGVDKAGLWARLLIWELIRQEEFLWLQLVNHLRAPRLSSANTCRSCDFAVVFSTSSASLAWAARRLNASRITRVVFFASLFVDNRRWCARNNAGFEASLMDLSKPVNDWRWRWILMAISQLAPLSVQCNLTIKEMSNGNVCMHLALHSASARTCWPEKFYNSAPSNCTIHFLQWHTISSDPLEFESCWRLSFHAACPEQDLFSAFVTKRFNLFIVSHVV